MYKCCANVIYLGKFFIGLLANPLPKMGVTPNFVV